MTSQKPITVKQWLMRARRIDKEIDQMLEERRAMFERLTSITAQLTGDTVSASKDPHKFEAYALYEAEINRKVDEFCKVKLEITQAVNKLEDRNMRMVLYLRYIKYLTLEQTASAMNYSYPQICILQGKAFQALQDYIELDGTPVV